MKQSNEKKQDLLLDALSCIDDEILEKGLSLREGIQASVCQDGSHEAERSANPYLFHLTPPPKPPKRNPWRATAVVAAACLLFCVIPLSVWMAASFGMDFFLPSKSEDAAADTPEEAPDGAASKADTHLPDDEIKLPQNSAAECDSNPSENEFPNEEPDLPVVIGPDGEETRSEGILPDEEAESPEDARPDPGAPQEPSDAETEALDESAFSDTPEDDMPESPVEDMTEAETAFESNGMSWTTHMNTNQLFGYRGISPWGTTVEMIGTVEMEGKPIGQTVSPEDELVLKLAGQWFLSAYCLDYGAHFPLFPDEIVADHILPEIENMGLTFDGAVEKIGRIANELGGFETLNLSLHLISNELLTGADLVTYQKKFDRYHLDLADGTAITTVRKFQFAEENQVIVDERLWIDPINVLTTFYAYEYNGRWYLDTQTCLEDDLCIDLLQSDPENSPFYEPRFRTGVITGLDADYLILDGLALQIGNVPLPDGIKVGDTVNVTYHGLGATFLAEESDGVIQTPEPKVSVYKLDHVDHVDEKNT